jgi:hypothetical protein
MKASAAASIFLQQFVESSGLGTRRFRSRLIWTGKGARGAVVRRHSCRLAWKTARLYPDQTEVLGARNRLRPSVDGELYEYVLDM